MFTHGEGDLYELLDPHVEWAPLSSALEGISYQGEDGVRGWMEEMQREWDFFETRPVEFHDLGDEWVLVLGTWGARGRGSGVELDSQAAAWLMRFKAGRVTRLQTFSNRDAALEAAGIVA